MGSVDLVMVARVDAGRVAAGAVDFEVLVVIVRVRVCVGVSKAAVAQASANRQHYTSRPHGRPLKPIRPPMAPSTPCSYFCCPAANLAPIRGMYLLFFRMRFGRHCKALRHCCM